MSITAEDICHISVGDGPLIAAAIHDGHDVRPEVSSHLALGDAERLREEDPYTARWATVVPTRLVGLRSRFEVDLNRPRETAIYRLPSDAWGLQVWKAGLPDVVVEASLAGYDAFYAAAYDLLDEVRRRHGRFVVLDLHSYNHRRDAAAAAPADPAGNPEVNIGTGSMDRDRWSSVVDRFVDDLRSCEVVGRHLDVRENVKFRGGAFAQWVHHTFPETGCALAIEFKKFFMDEWTGEPDVACVEAIREALSACVPGLLDALDVR